MNRPRERVCNSYIEIRDQLLNTESFTMPCCIWPTIAHMVSSSSVCSKWARVFLFNQPRARYVWAPKSGTMHWKLAANMPKWLIDPMDSATPNCRGLFTGMNSTQRLDTACCLYGTMNGGPPMKETSLLVFSECVCMCGRVWVCVCAGL